MQLQKSMHNYKKYIFLYGLVICVCLLFPKNAEAFIPEINVRVINSVTNAPVPGVWVRQKNTGMGTNPGWSSFMTNNCSGENSTEPIDGRFIITDAAGNATFPDPEVQSPSICDQPIDSNKDGVNDTVAFPCTVGERRDVNGNPTPGTTCTAYGEFSCYGNPFRFDVIKPVGDTGTYSSISGVVMPNAAADMELTILYTPQGAPLPTPTATPNPITSATKKEIGTLSAIGQKFQPLKELEANKDYWVRIQIFNGGRSYSHTWLYETVNSEYLELYQPSYNSPETATFFIEGYVSHGASFEMKDRTSIECPDPGPSSLPSCISYTTGSSSFIARPTEPLTEIANPYKYIYFKVRTKKDSGGAPIKVDVDDTYPAHTGSYVDYVDLPNAEINEPGVDNEDVVICPVGGCINNALGYVQVLLGNVYSHYVGPNIPITFELPLNTAFVRETVPTRKTGILFQRDPKLGNYGAGKAADSGWYVQGYSHKTAEWTYDSLYEEYKQKPIQTKNLAGVNQLDNGIGYYIDQGSTTANPKKFVVSGGNWKNQTITNKQAVIFVPGDLYINENIDVAADGNSSITFIVKGNIGIDPLVTNIEGIFITDGVIDTTCSSVLGFSGTICPSTAPTPNIQVALEGLYYANGGFVLDRNTTAEPAETFRFRPDFIISVNKSLGKNLYSWVENSN